jgi:hypothetical protein
LILAFDLGESAPSLGGAVRGPREELAITLLAMLDRAGLPGTWAVADPASCNLAARLRLGHQRHEVAIRANHAWTGGASRGRIATDLRQRVNRARAAGCEVTSVLLAGVRLDHHFDLLVKHGITALLAGEPQTKPSRQRTGRSGGPLGGASCLRFGLWETDATVRFPSRADWLWRGAGVQPRNYPGGAARSPAVNLVAVDVPALVEKGQRGLRLMDRVFRMAIEHRNAQTQEVITARDLVRRLASERKAAPAQSILRRAA